MPRVVPHKCIHLFICLLSPLDIIYYILFIGKCQVVILHKYLAKKLCNLHKYKNRVAYNRRRRGEYKYKKERAEKSAH